MFFILIGVIGVALFNIAIIKEKRISFSSTVLSILLLGCFIALGTICDWGHEDFHKVEEIQLYEYENSDKYIKVSKNYYYFVVNKNEEYDVEYDSLEEDYVLRSETDIYEKENIENPVIVRYTAKPIKNFITMGLRENDEMYKIYIPTGTIGIK